MGVHDLTSSPKRNRKFKTADSHFMAVSFAYKYFTQFFMIIYILTRRDVHKNLCRIYQYAAISPNGILNSEYVWQYLFI